MRIATGWRQPTLLLIRGVVPSMALAVGVVLGCRGQPERSRAVILASSEAGEAEALHVASSRLRDLIRSQSSAYSGAEDLAVLVEVLVPACLGGDPTAYWERLAATSAVVNVEMARSLAGDWHRWGIIDRDPKTLDDESLLALLWSGARRGGMVVEEIDMGSIDLGNHLRLAIGRDVWEYAGARGQTSIFLPPGGWPGAAVLDRIDGTNRACSLSVRVKFADGRWGRVRAHLWYDEIAGRWYPVSLGVGSEPDAQWPFPLV